MNQKEIFFFFLFFLRKRLPSWTSRCCWGRLPEAQEQLDLGIRRLNTSSQWSIIKNRAGRGREKFFSQRKIRAYCVIGKGRENKRLIGLSGSKFKPISFQPPFFLKKKQSICRQIGQVESAYRSANSTTLICHSQLLFTSPMPNWQSCRQQLLWPSSRLTYWTLDMRDCLQLPIVKLIKEDDKWLWPSLIFREQYFIFIEKNGNNWKCILIFELSWREIKSWTSL